MWQPITFRLRKEDHAALHKQAARESRATDMNISVNTIVNKAIREYIRNHGGAHDLVPKGLTTSAKCREIRPEGGARDAQRHDAALAKADLPTPEELRAAIQRSRDTGLDVAQG